MMEMRYVSARDGERNREDELLVRFVGYLISLSLSL